MNNIIDERNEAYGDAWMHHGIVTKFLAPQVMELLTRFPQYYFAWTMILNKLIRALTTPLNEDHWVDIIGYAELVLRDIRKRSTND